MTKDTDGYLVLTNFTKFTYRVNGQPQIPTGTWFSKYYPKSYLWGGRTTTDTDRYLVFKYYPKSYGMDR